MLIKLIIIAAILYGLYRLAGGRILPEKFSRPEHGKKKEDPGAPALDGDTLVECAHCSTYVVKKEAILYKGKHYCSRDCLPK